MLSCIPLRWKNQGPAHLKLGRTGVTARHPGLAFFLRPPVQQPHDRQEQQAQRMAVHAAQFWLRAEYFVKHLLGDHRWSVNVTELEVERPQTGGR